MANNDKENKIEKFTKEAIGKTLNQFNKEIGMADLVEVNKNQDRILNGILSQVNDENTEKTEKSNVIMLDNSTDGIVELQEIQGDTNVNVSKIVEETPITHAIEDKEGNVISLDGVTEGAINIDNIQGNTMVNCNKEPDKELILMEDLSTEGYSNVTLTEGVDGGLVDVALEGNTMVNVCDQKDPVAITKSYTVETGNHVALQGEYDGKCRPVVTGNTLVNILKVKRSSNNIAFLDNKYMLTGTVTILNACKSNSIYVNRFNLENNSYVGATLITSNCFKLNIPNGQFIYSIYDNSTDYIPPLELTKDIIILQGDYTNKPMLGYFQGLKSSFEDKVITQEMVDAGEEVAENLGKYKVDYVISREDGTVGQTKTFYLNSPLLEGDTIEQQGNNVVHVHRSELRAYQTDDELTLPTDMTNTLVAKATPQYEVISQNDTILCDSYVNGHLDVDSIVPIKKVKFRNWGKSLKYLYASTPYTIQFEADNNGIINGLYSGGLKASNVNVTKGLNKINFTTSNTQTYNGIDFDGIGFNASNIVVTEATDQDFGYYEGMKSVGECEDLEVVSSNSDGTLSNTQTLTHEPLRAVGDIKDKYVLIDGKWYIERNCAEVSPDGNNTTKTNVYEGQRGSRFKVKCPNVRMVSQELVISNKFRHMAITSSWQTEGQYIATDEFVGDLDYALVRLNNDLTVDEFLRQHNDLVIVYPLATPTYEPIDYTPFTVYSDITHISNNSTIPCNMTIKNTGYNCLLKPSTTYTVSSNLGLNIVTTPSVLSEDCLRFYDTDASTVTTMKDVTILEGDYTTGKPIPSHFSGMESAFEQEYDEAVGKYKVKAKVVGKNLFNGEWHNGWLHNGNVVLSNNYKYCDYIRVPSNTKITVKTSFDIAEYDYNKNFIKNNGEGRTTITTSSNCYYIRIGVRSSQDISNYQVEEGTEVTPYESYKENYIEFYINEPLRGIGNVKDKVYVKNDKVIVERNCGSVTFDGSDDEKWGIKINTKVNTILYLMSLKNITHTNLYTARCDKFNNIDCWNNDYEGIQLANEIYVRLNLHRSKANSVKEFKQWLSENPTTVVYERAEPVYEEVEYSESRLFLNTYNNSTLFYESNIPVSNTSFKPLWEELAYLKNSTKYYIQFNSSASGTVVFNLGGTELTTEIVEGYNCIPITTPSESTNLMTISGQGITISEVVVSEAICGGYYKGLQSCFEEHMENGKYRILLRGIALDGSKVNGIKLYINEPLRGIGDVKDRLCIKNGKLMVERKCGSVVFKGSDDETWSDKWTETFGIPNYTIFSINLNDKGSGIGYCNLFKEGNLKNLKNECILLNEGTRKINVGINILNTKLQTQDILGFKQWLQQNPVTVVYELSEPIYEEATNEYGLPIVFEGYENGIVYIDSAVTPTTHIKYTSNNQLATTLAEAEEQNIATQEDINMNVITYMMDIDMMLTDMEMSNDISVMAVRRDSSNENMLDRMSDEDKKVYRDNTVVMLEKMITANVLEKEDIEGRIDMYYNKNRISKEQYEYLKSLL